MAEPNVRSNAARPRGEARGVPNEIINASKDGAHHRSQSGSDPAAHDGRAR